MSWWVIILLPLPVFALLGVGLLVGIAFDTSAEDASRRVRSWRLADAIDAGVTVIDRSPLP